jgi:hypothetical protein
MAAARAPSGRWALSAALLLLALQVWNARSLCCVMQVAPPDVSTPQAVAGARHRLAEDPSALGATLAQHQALSADADAARKETLQTLDETLAKKIAADRDDFRREEEEANARLLAAKSRMATYKAQQEAQAARLAKKIDDERQRIKDATAAAVNQIADDRARTLKALADDQQRLQAAVKRQQEQALQLKARQDAFTKAFAEEEERRRLREARQREQADKLAAIQKEVHDQLLNAHNSAEQKRTTALRVIRDAEAQMQRIVEQQQQQLQAEKDARQRVEEERWKQEALAQKQRDDIKARTRKAVQQLEQQAQQQRNASLQFRNHLEEQRQAASLRQLALAEKAKAERKARLAAEKALRLRREAELVEADRVRVLEMQRAKEHSMELRRQHRAKLEMDLKQKSAKIATSLAQHAKLQAEIEEARQREEKRQALAKQIALQHEIRRKEILEKLRQDAAARVAAAAAGKSSAPTSPQPSSSDDAAAREAANALNGANKRWGITAPSTGPQQQRRRRQPASLPQYEKELVEMEKNLQAKAAAHDAKWREAREAAELASKVGNIPSVWVGV